MKIPLFTQDGEKKGDLTVSDQIFSTPLLEAVIHRALLYQQANARKPIAHTKTKGEVRGGGRKPFRQKGTGNARQGSKRSPLMPGGGVVFGPRNTRNFSLQMPKKERRKALFSALADKARAAHVSALENFETKDGKAKTKLFAEMIGKLPFERNVLFVMPPLNDSSRSAVTLMKRSTANLPNVKAILVNYLNIVDLLKYQDVLLHKNAAEALEDIFVTHTPAHHE